MSDYYIIITDAGAALEAAAHAAGEPLVLTEFGVCDGGADLTPDPAMTALPGEVYRGKISSLSVSADDENVLVAQCIIPAASGGYTIRGGGLYASDGTLYAVGNYPDQPKPAPDSGYAASLEVLVQLAVSGTADVTLNVTDGAWLTKAEGDQLYLEAAKNLSDLTDAAKAREALSLDKVGNWMAVQANGGLHSSGNHRIYIDWGPDNKAHLTVDTSDEGELFTTVNPPTAAQTGAYPRAGGNLDEEASITVISKVLAGNTGDFLYGPLFRSCLQGRGGDQDFKDGASFFMRIVEHVGTEAYGELVFDGFGTTQSFRFSQTGDFLANRNVYAGQGFLAIDGNVYGPIWGGYLRDWLNGQIGSLNNSISGVSGTASDAWNKANDAQNNRVSDVALGARWTGALPGGGGLESPAAGYVMTGWYTEGQNPGGDTLVFRPVQKYVPSMGWVNVGHTA
ncbi:phage tail protein [Pantoea agglomerans]|uniref:phage tail protein n=1 Tax=Enterobacter agglomerans TaxID=549 RepID=UPI0013BD4224|nr:phage tail protein [Pantoea agglomerans]NEG58182.1 hypothetical protein [Pantoea agglomerans]NEG99895.1 hypothetical protein [Pantoea agglomerans]NEH04142.1 hypothetical protein [Pantoea agglomerans]NEH14455.1 hypothetical protein [Pantoea agglomerans]